MLSKGGGTFHEDWDGRGTRLYDSMPYVGGFFIESFGGIRQSDSGYRRFVLQPYFACDTGPTWVNESYESPQGRIGVRRRKTAETVTLHLEVPPDSWATLHLPQLQSLQDHRAADGKVEPVLQSGTYEITGTFR